MISIDVRGTEVTVSGGASYTMNFSWENGKTTVQMDDIWGW